LQLPDIKKIQAVTTIDQAIEGTTIVKFCRSLGKPEAIMVIADIICMKVGEWNLPNTLNTEQAFNVAEMIVTENPYMTVEDLVIMFREALMRKPGYKTTYNVLNAAVIFEWLNNYIERKLDRQEELREQQKAREKDELREASAEIMERLAPLLTKVIDAASEPKKAEPKRASMEQHTKFVIEHLDDYTVEELKKMKRTYVSHNMFGVYDELLNEIDKHLNDR
jgi:hypothetical protein